MPLETKSVGATVIGEPIYFSTGQSNKNDANVVFYPVANDFERVANCDEYVQNMGTPLKSLAVSPNKIIKIVAVIPAVLESGKQILIGVFDIRDIWKERRHPAEQQLQAMILPDEFAANVFLNNPNVAEA